MEEIWKPIAGFKNYQVSSLGNVKSMARYKPMPTGGTQLLPEAIMKKKIVKGYYCVTLCKKGKPYYKRVCRLVASAFHKNPLKKPMVNHKDTNKLNDYYENLEWATGKENSQHAVKMGVHFSPACKGEENGRSKLSSSKVLEIREHKKEGLSNRKIAKLYNVSNVLIGLVINGKNWSHV